MLDTDYDNFVVLYSCQEGANYFHKDDPSKLPLFSLDDIWQNHKRLPNPDHESSHTLTAFETLPELIKEPVHKERIQILWRMPTFGDEVRDNKEALHRAEEPTSEELENYLDGVTRSVPGMTKDRLSKQFGLMDHNGNSRTDFMLE